VWAATVLLSYDRWVLPSRQGASVSRRAAHLVSQKCICRLHAPPPPQGGQSDRQLSSSPAAAATASFPLPLQSWRVAAAVAGRLNKALVECCCGGGRRLGPRGPARARQPARLAQGRAARRELKWSRTNFDSLRPASPTTNQWSLSRRWNQTCCFGVDTALKPIQIS